MTYLPKMSIIAVAILFATPAVQSCFRSRNHMFPWIHNLNRSNRTTSAASSAASAAFAANAAIAAATALASAVAKSGSNITTVIYANASGITEAGSGSNSAAVANSALLGLLGALGLGAEVIDVRQNCTPPIRKSRLFEFSVSPEQFEMSNDTSVLVSCTGRKLAVGCTPTIFINKASPQTLIEQRLNDLKLFGKKKRRDKRQISQVGTCTACDGLERGGRENSNGECECRAIFTCNAKGHLVVESNGQAVYDVFCGPQCPFDIDGEEDEYNEDEHDDDEYGEGRKGDARKVEQSGEFGGHKKEPSVAKKMNLPAQTMDEKRAILDVKENKWVNAGKINDKSLIETKMQQLHDQLRKDNKVDGGKIIATTHHVDKQTKKIEEDRNKTANEREAHEKTIKLLKKKETTPKYDGNNGHSRSMADKKPIARTDKSLENVVSDKKGGKKQSINAENSFENNDQMRKASPRSDNLDTKLSANPENVDGELAKIKNHLSDDWRGENLDEQLRLVGEQLRRGGEKRPRELKKRKQYRRHRVDEQPVRRVQEVSFDNAEEKIDF